MSDTMPEQDDEFDKMFAQAVAGKEPEPAPAADAVADTPVETPEPVASDADALPEPEAVETETDADPEPAPVAAQPPQNDALMERFIQAMESRNGQQDAPKQQQSAPPAPPLYSEAETKLLTDYEKDWPDVAKAEALRRRGEYRDLIGYVFQQVGDYLGTRLTPLEAVTQNTAERSHVDELYRRIPDYDAVREPAINWAMSQPPYLKVAFQQVIEKGGPEDVADLVSRFRQATGAQAPSQQAAPIAAPQPAPAVRKAAAALAPVRSQRSSAATNEQPEDFDSAFAMWTKAKAR